MFEIELPKIVEATTLLGCGTKPLDVIFRRSLISDHFTSGGGTATYTTHWLDTVKVKMQTFPTEYRGGYHCLRDTVKGEGLRGLFSGAAPAVTGQVQEYNTIFPFVSQPVIWDQRATIFYGTSDAHVNVLEIRRQHSVAKIKN